MVVSLVTTGAQREMREVRVEPLELAIVSEIQRKLVEVSGNVGLSRFHFDYWSLNGVHIMIDERIA